MRLKDIIKTKAEIEKLGYDIENNIIEKISVNIIGHFANCPCLEIWCSNVLPMSDYNSRQNLGYILSAFVELFDIAEEDGLRLEKIRNVPCRLIFESKGARCIGFGSFMRDKFVLTADFAKIDA